MDPLGKLLRSSAPEFFVLDLGGQEMIDPKPF